MNYLYNCNLESAKIWNECVKISDLIYKEEKRFAQKSDLAKCLTWEFSDILPSHVIQVMYFKFIAMKKSAMAARKSGRTDIKFPYKEKKYWNTVWDYMCFRIDRVKNRILISKPMIRDGRTPRSGKKQNSIIVKTKIKIPDNIYKIELVFKGGRLQLALNYSVDVQEVKPSNNNSCGVDLGEIHSIAAMDSNGNKLIVTGRKLRSYYRFFNKEQGKIHKLLSNTTKGSNNYWKYRKALQKLRYKKDCKVKYHLNCTAKMFINWCIENGISNVYVGDLKNYNMNLKNSKDRKGNKQRLSNWSHGQLLNIIQYKAFEYGITIHEISESYTSQICPNCGTLNKPKGRNYDCNCGFRFHRDLVGAVNILFRATNQRPDDLTKELKYLTVA